MTIFLSLRDYGRLVLLPQDEYVFQMSLMHYDNEPNRDRGTTVWIGHVVGDEIELRGETAEDHILFRDRLDVGRIFLLQGTTFLHFSLILPQEFPTQHTVGLGFSLPFTVVDPVAPTTNGIAGDHS
jgi:hypothetical protein